MKTSTATADTPRYNKPDGGWARRLVGLHTVSSMPSSLTAPRDCLAWRLGCFVTNSCEKYGLGLKRVLVMVAKHQGRIHRDEYGPDALKEQV